MRTLRPLLAAVVAVLLGIAGAQAADAFTVGDFLVAIAQAEGLPVVDGPQARSALAERGVPVGTELELESALTEREVVGIARSLGLHVASTRPEASFDARQSARFVAAFVEEWDAGDGSRTHGADEEGEEGNGDGFDPFTKGKGHAKGHSKGKSKGKGKKPPHSPID